MLNSICVYDMAHQPPTPRIPHYWTPRHLYSRMVDQDPGEIIEMRLWNKLDSVSVELSSAGHQAGLERWSWERERLGRGLWGGCICIINKGQTAGCVWLWGLLFWMCQCEVLRSQNTLFTNERISQGHFLCLKKFCSVAPVISFHLPCSLKPTAGHFRWRSLSYVEDVPPFSLYRIN